MHVAHLSLADFRSYARAEVPLDPGVTAFVGPNGQGKTNLVEAVGYVATLGSHRVATDAPLIRLGAESAVVRTSVVDRGRSTLVELEITRARPTGPGSTAPTTSARAMCWACCAPCCSPPRTSPWSRATWGALAASWTSC